jgi:hypothetical protein
VLIVQLDRAATADRVDAHREGHVYAMAAQLFLASFRS